MVEVLPGWHLLRSPGRSIPWPPASCHPCETPWCTWCQPAASGRSSVSWMTVKGKTDMDETVKGKDRHGWDCQGKRQTWMRLSREKTDMDETVKGKDRHGWDCQGKRQTWMRLSREKTDMDETVKGKDRHGWDCQGKRQTWMRLSRKI